MSDRAAGGDGIRVGVDDRGVARIVIHRLHRLNALDSTASTSVAALLLPPEFHTAVATFGGATTSSRASHVRTPLTAGRSPHMTGVADLCDLGGLLLQGEALSDNTFRIHPTRAENVTVGEVRGSDVDTWTGITAMAGTCVLTGVGT